MAKYNRTEDKIVGKIIIRANLKNETPLLIGKGGGDSVDIEVIRMPDEKPYIPASSIAGVLKNFMISNGLSVDNDYLWGRSGKNELNPLQSHIRIDDLVPLGTTSHDIVIRDGVKINHETGTAEDKKKYEYEVVEPGIIFPFQAEITIRNSMADVKIPDFVSKLNYSLCHQNFRIGAQTNTGFGKIACTEFKAYIFIFPKDVEAWFSYLDSDEISIPEIKFEEVFEIDQEDTFSIDAIFRLKSSLLIGAYGIKGCEPDKSQLKSRDKFVLSGKSIRGAIRHRAIKILNTLEDSEPTDKINALFGFVSEDEREQKRGRLRVEEFEFKSEEVTPIIQNRIRIDRFTGGVIDGALFNSEPIWSKGDEAVKLKFTITEGATPEEKKLLLMILKDLWMEDLAIGGEKNVGRGILTGQEATIYNDGKSVAKFKRDGGKNGLKFIHGSAKKLKTLFHPKKRENA